MAIIFPIICFVVIFLTLIRRRDALLRENLLLASLAFSAIIFISTEALSLLGQINNTAFIIFWLLALAGSIAASWNELKNITNPLVLNLKELEKHELFYVFSAFLICFVIFIIALIYPASTHDAMTYHLSRVGNWIENRSVSFYATNDLRQLTYGPMAGYYALHILILTGSDVFLNFIQFFAMIGSVFAISLLARQFGAKRGGQIISAVALITLPMGIIQAGSAQNDHVLSYFLIVFVYFLNKSILDSRPLNMLAAGAALGFCFLTKATAYLFAFPFLTWYLFKQLNDSRPLLIKKISIILFSALLLNVAHYSRNINLCAHPLTCPELGAKTKNAAITPPLLVSNITKNIALQWRSPFKGVNDLITAAVIKLHEFMKLDLNDPRNTYEQTYFFISDYVFDEDFAGNFIHHILIIILIFGILFNARQRQKRKLFEYALVIVSIFLLFNLYLKWQPWGSRLLLPLFILCAPIIGIQLEALKRQRLAVMIVSVLLVMSVPWVVFNRTRPLIAKKNPFNTSYTKRYYLPQHRYEESYTNAINTINASHCKKIGLHLQFNSWEFPLWYFLNKKKGGDYSIQSIGVDNASSRFEKSNFKPCILVDNVVLDRRLKDTITINNQEYILIRRMSVLNLFKPK